MVVQIDSEIGVETRLEYVPTPRGLLYAWSARPSDARFCVLVCSSILGDFSSNYNRERALGRSLAAAGIGVVRFHYSGEGNSHGDREAMTFDTISRDTAAVFDYAVSLGFSDFALLGTRIGALVAAAFAVNQPAFPLALWEPIVNPLQFFTEGQRAQRISQVAREDQARTRDWRAELNEKGVLDLLGHDVYPALVESLAAVDLMTLLGSKPRPIFVGRFRASAQPDSLVEELKARGFPVRVEHFGLAESWWFDRNKPLESEELTPATVAWLQEVLTGHHEYR